MKVHYSLYNLLKQLSHWGGIWLLECQWVEPSLNSSRTEGSYGYWNVSEPRVYKPKQGGGSDWRTFVCMEIWCVYICVRVCTYIMYVCVRMCMCLYVCVWTYGSVRMWPTYPVVQAEGCFCSSGSDVGLRWGSIPTPSRWTHHPQTYQTTEESATHY